MKYGAFALTLLVAIAVVAAAGTAFTFLCSPCNSPDSLDSRGGSNGCAFSPHASANCFDQRSNATIAVLLSDEDGEGEDEGKGEKDEGDEKKEEDAGPDRIWGAAKLG